MKCPECFSLETHVKSTRTADTGIVSRRRECSDCEHRFTTLELPPAAASYARADIQKWEARQTGEWKTKVRQRQKIAELMCQKKALGIPCEALAKEFKLSVHMAYYYTKPSNMAKYVKDKNAG